MDVPYKGYTIIANSERQPDGRWLPVAELEVTERGVVTAKPPLRATALETRATRGDADVAAVKMAKAWIDANEREVVVTRPGPPPALEPAHPAPVAAVPPPAAPAPPSARTRPSPPPMLSVPEDPDWTGLCRAVGLDSDDKVQRLSRLLLVQLLLDRLVAVMLAGKLASPGAGPEIGALLADVAPLPLPARIELAARLGLIAPAIAESLAEAGRVRDRLLHGKPPRGKPGWDVSGAEELASAAAGDRCLRRGIEAAQGLLAALRARPTGT
ncbi:MAG TPA: hypothetical protein VLK28_02060 [Methylomirabilota bacterium]|nr:hypothetical protein [Methylomirabilota bacterium]